MNFNFFIAKILKQNYRLFGDNPTWKVIEEGRKNRIIDVNSQYILKICIDYGNEQLFKNEIAFYLLNKDCPYIPKLYSYSINRVPGEYMYQITEMLHGKPLFYLWSDFNEDTRRKTMEELATILKMFHNHKKEGFDYGTFVANVVSKNVDQCINKGLLNKNEELSIREAIKSFPFFLRSKEVALIHNDLNFDNILYYNGIIKIVDFEKSMYAPIDKEIDVFLRMCDNPLKYAPAEARKYIVEKDYQEAKQYLKDYYPEIFDAPNLNERIVIYDFRFAIELLLLNGDDKIIKEVIMKCANTLITNYKKYLA